MVSGSDVKKSKNTDRLETLFNIRIAEGHAAENVQDAQVVVYSSAVKEDNPEVVVAKENGIPVIPRAEMLAELMTLKPYAVAVSGTHGKTSTTSMIATILGYAGVDPTTVVGGVVDTLGSNARLGSFGLVRDRGRRERPLVPDALSDDRRRYEHRQRAHGIVQGHGRRRSVLYRFCK